MYIMVVSVCDWETDKLLFGIFTQLKLQKSQLIRNLVGNKKTKEILNR